MEDDVRNQLKTKSISTILYQGGAPKPWAALQTMQVWQTVSSSRQRARNAERITKKPLGHAVGTGGGVARVQRTALLVEPC